MATQLAWYINGSVYRLDTNNPILLGQGTGIMVNGKLTRVTDSLAKTLPYYQPTTNYGKGQFLFQYDPSKFVVNINPGTVPTAPQTPTPAPSPTPAPAPSPLPNPPGGVIPPKDLLNPIPFTPPTATQLAASLRLQPKPGETTEQVVARQVPDMTANLRQQIVNMQNSNNPANVKTSFIQSVLNTIRTILSGNANAL